MEIIFIDPLGIKQSEDNKHIQALNELSEKYLGETLQEYFANKNFDISNGFYQWKKAVLTEILQRKKTIAVQIIDKFLLDEPLNNSGSLIKHLIKKGYGYYPDFDADFGQIFDSDKGAPELLYEPDEQDEIKYLDLLYENEEFFQLGEDTGILNENFPQIPEVIRVYSWMDIQSELNRIYPAGSALRSYFDDINDQPGVSNEQKINMTAKTNRFFRKS